MQIRIQKNQVRFFQSREIEAGVFKDVLEFGIQRRDGKGATFGVQVQKDVGQGQNITGAEIASAIASCITELQAQQALNATALTKVEALPGVTLDTTYLYAEIGS